MREDETMTRALVTGNHAAGFALAAAGEANRGARGCCSGVYPITPQTEIIEYLSATAFTKGVVVPVESEHSAMAVCIGASIDGARAFTASASNGLLYMTENVYAAGYYRLPIVMVASNRTLGPPWNIWVDQGDTLALRDAAWLQFYCESHQELVDTILLAFRVAEDPRILLPALVAQDGFILSHTQMVVDLPEQALVDRYLPELQLAHRLDAAHPRTYGGMTWPRDTLMQREEIQGAMELVPTVLAEAIEEFVDVFGRRPQAAVTALHTADADSVVVASSTLARMAQHVVETRRALGERVGLVKVKLFRPFPRDELLEALGSAGRVAVIDRDHSPGSGGIFWGEAACSLPPHSQLLLQGYIVGLGGVQVHMADLDNVLDDLSQRTSGAAPVFVYGGPQ
jgi:pyruvate/2-oxoacid:ferredoxin oxidoreductase alpha subunit